MPEKQDASQRADALHEEGMKKSDAGDEDGALALYLEALALDHNRPNTLYNVGLAYKYRRDWEKSLRYNLQSLELRADSEATNWNAGIAATALGRWDVARAAWKRLGMEMPEGDGPIDANFGYTPVRLNGFEETDDAVEVVWAYRRSPVTAAIDNIPTPAARYRFGDLVLHDGAATGRRDDGQGNDCPVFNVFQLLEPSKYITHDVVLMAPDAAAIDSLRQACEEAEVAFEDWTTMRVICKACSEGREHDQHELIQPGETWEVARRVGIAALDTAIVEGVLEDWCAGGEGRSVDSVEAWSLSPPPRRWKPGCAPTISRSPSSGSRSTRRTRACPASPRRRRWT